MRRNEVRLNAPALTAALTALYEAYGCSDHEARTVSGHLVTADLSGHPSHGSGLTPVYVGNMTKGLLCPNRMPEQVETGGDFMLFDGQNGFGQSIGLQVCDAVAERVRSRGVAVFGLRNVHHLGRLGAYGEYLAREGIVSATFTNVASRAMVAPFKGTRAVLGTNPVCIGIPREGRDPVLLDFATSTIAIGKVRVAFESGEEAPSGALIDASGQPTRDPSVMYPPEGQPSGALTAMAAHKGAGLNLICELLAAIIGGVTMNRAVGQGAILNNMVGMAFAADTTHRAGAALEAALKHYLETPAQDGYRMLLPGDMEYAKREELAANGLPMPETTWEAIVSLGVDRGVDASKFRQAQGVK